MDYRAKRVTNGYFSVEFSDERLHNGLHDQCYAYAYDLGARRVTLQLIELETSRFLELYQQFQDAPFNMALHVSKPTARGGGELAAAVNRYYGVFFHNCRMETYRNSGSTDRVEGSSVEIELSFEQFEPHYPWP
ncbi:hypothetical protein [Magnetofaba australis]|uniref:Uncharacterized protein n=1 Tax=Magnetofaba australis IT-1 TaxID=1434232 RepID=A0A1Y2K3X2_9PROT|nr:hypothetical protein [Magnetofaba australis]OSM01814.1 hypothetical protein MAIT1_01853 [Magnetofaba australis IT-1]